MVSPTVSRLEDFSQEHSRSFGLILHQLVAITHIVKLQLVALNVNFLPFVSFIMYPTPQRVHLCHTVFSSSSYHEQLAPVIIKSFSGPLHTTASSIRYEQSFRVKVCADNVLCASRRFQWTDETCYFCFCCFV